MVGLEQMAFMSISFLKKLDEREIEETEIQRRKSFNFKTECLEETKNFFYDSKNKKFKNQSFIQFFSFLDFGQGIVTTLKEQFLKEKNYESENLESDILRFAFKYNSSRHPIFYEKNKLDKFIPRGLFDALSIVRRYGGLFSSKKQ